MSVDQFLLAMNFGRILLMISTITWLSFTKADRHRIVVAMVGVCLVMLLSNLLNAILVVGVLKVVLW